MLSVLIEPPKFVYVQLICIREYYTLHILLGRFNDSRNLLSFAFKFHLCIIASWKTWLLSSGPYILYVYSAAHTNIQWQQNVQTTFSSPYTVSDPSKQDVIGNKTDKIHSSYPAVTGCLNTIK